MLVDIAATAEEKEDGRKDEKFLQTSLQVLLYTEGLEMNFAFVSGSDRGANSRLWLLNVRD